MYEDDNISNESEIKTINDLFSFQSKEPTQKQKDIIQQRIQMHIEPDPNKREQLKKIKKMFNLKPDLSYKHGLPPTIRKYLKADKSFLNKINWEKWGFK
jgi:hypothetical protein